MFRYVILLLAVLATGAARAEDPREGYYYPPVTSEEVFARVLQDMPEMGPDKRVEFVITVTLAQIAAPDTQPFVMFEKGDRSEHLIVIGLDDQMFRTLYRARAVMAQMTDKIRGGRFFKSEELKQTATFYDMLLLMGFETLTLSDGATWAHRVTFKKD